MKFYFYLIILVLLINPFYLKGESAKIFVSGYVTALESNTPVGNHIMNVKFINEDPPYLHFDQTKTNIYGYYSFVLHLPFSEGVLQVSTIDCANQLITNTLEFSRTQTVLTSNFSICHQQQSGMCRSDFFWVTDPEQHNKVIFRQAAFGNITEWLWDFGDGNYSQAPDPIHIFEDDAVYNVCLTVFDDSGACADTYCYGIESYDDTLVQARYTWYPVPGNSATVQFYDLSLGNVTDWSWDLGDGRTVNTRNPRHTYKSPGFYNVCLTVQKPGNQNDTFCIEIEAAVTGKCQPAFLHFPDPLDAMTYHFVDLSLGEIDNWNWDFGDGNFSSEQHPVHTFTSEGLHRVQLTTEGTENNCGQTTGKAIFVSQQNGSVALFRHFKSQSNELSFRFTDQSSAIADRWFWDFGDGNTSTLQNPVYQFTAVGSYQVCLTISDQDETFSDTFCKMIHAGIAPDCSARFTLEQDLTNPLVYHFTNTSHGENLTHLWDFGDGSSSTEEHPTHLFVGEGIARVCLTIQDSSGTCVDTFCKMLTVEAGQPLQPEFDLFVFPDDPLNVQFVNQAAGRYDIRIWDFGDGEYAFEENPQHLFSDEGETDVCLHLLNSDQDAGAETWKTIQLSSTAHCEASFAALQSVSDPLTVRFANLSKGEIAAWNWDFGDGNLSTLKNPVHSYQDAGAYNVCLQVTDYFGTCTDIFCMEIEIDFQSDCEAAFSYEPAQDQSLTVLFNDLSQGSFDAWHWDFGDGNTSEIQHPSHAYADSGYFTVTLNIWHTDPAILCNQTVSEEIYVFAPTPDCYANFIAHPDSGVNKPNYFHFHDISTGEPNEWFWDFGDGHTSTLQHPKHQYAQSDTYEVSLTVKHNNPFGDDCSHSITQTVTSPNYFHIGGFVFAGHFPINNPAPTGDTAQIMLYRHHGNKVMPVDTSLFTQNGYYFSLYLLQDHYMIKARLTGGSQHSVSFFPTYFGNNLMWQDANTHYVSDSNHYHLNIHLKELPELASGPGSISGTVLHHLIREHQMVTANNTQVLLFDESLNPLSYAFTGNSGHFSFDDLPLGTYYLTAESAGKLCEKVAVSLTDTNPSAKDLLIELYDPGATPVNEVSTHQIPARIFPNPVKEVLFVDLQNEDYASVGLTVMDISGRTIFSTSFNLSGENSRVQLETGQLKPGIYLLNISDLRSGRQQTLKFVK